MRLRRIAIDQSMPTQQQHARHSLPDSQVAPAPSEEQTDEYSLRLEVEDSGAGISKENQVS